MNNAQTAERIKNLCKERKISITQVLLECGIVKSFIYDLEKRNSYPSCEKICILADYFNVPTDYLLGRTDNPNVIGTSIDKSQTVSINRVISSNIGNISNGNDKQQESNQDDTEILKLIKKLPLKKRIEFISMLYDELGEE